MCDRMYNRQQDGVIIGRTLEFRIPTFPISISISIFGLKVFPIFVPVVTRFRHDGICVTVGPRNATDFHIAQLW
jgi:hypothetical protein